MFFRNDFDPILCPDGRVPELYFFDFRSDSMELLYGIKIDRLSEYGRSDGASHHRCVNESLTLILSICHRRIAESRYHLTVFMSLRLQNLGRPERQVSFTLELTSFGPCCQQTERGAVRILAEHAISCIPTNFLGIKLLESFPRRLVPSRLREKDWTVLLLSLSKRMRILSTTLRG